MKYLKSMSLNDTIQTQKIVDNFDIIKERILDVKKNKEDPPVIMELYLSSSSVITAEEDIRISLKEGWRDRVDETKPMTFYIGKEGEYGFSLRQELNKQFFLNKGETLILNGANISSKDGSVEIIKSNLNELDIISSGRYSISGYWALDEGVNYGLESRFKNFQNLAFIREGYYGANKLQPLIFANSSIESFNSYDANFEDASKQFVSKYRDTYDISYMFKDCSNLTSVEFSIRPPKYYDKYGQVGFSFLDGTGIFENCPNLERVAFVNTKDPVIGYKNGSNTEYYIDYLESGHCSFWKPENVSHLNKINEIHYLAFLNKSDTNYYYNTIFKNPVTLEDYSFANNTGTLYLYTNTSSADPSIYTLPSNWTLVVKEARIE